MGATPVPVLTAKAFVDIMVGVEGQAQLEVSVPALSSIACTDLPEAEAVVAERRFFWRLGARLGDHVHVAEREPRL